MSQGSINGSGMGVMMSCGVPEDRKPVLDMLGIATQPPSKRRHGDGMVVRIVGTGDQGSYDHGLRVDVERHMLTGIRDRSPDLTREIGLQLFRHAPKGRPGNPSTAFDVVTLAHLEDIGVNPAWLLLIAAVADDVEIRLGDRTVLDPPDLLLGRFVADDEPIAAIGIPLSHDGRTAMWWGEGIEMDHGLPETARIATIGMPLREVVRHPLLDRFDLRIREYRGDRMIDVGYVPHEPIDWRPADLNPGNRA